MGIEIYGRPFSFGLEDGFVLSDVSHFLLIDSLYGACSLNWLGWKLVVFDFLSEIFLISIKDIVDLCNISVYYQIYMKT